MFWDRIDNCILPLKGECIFPEGTRERQCSVETKY